MSSVAIKLSFNDVIRRFQFKRDQSFNNLVEAAVKRYPELRSEGITFTYKDEDGDVVDVSTDGDLLAAFMVLDQEGWKAIRFNVCETAKALPKKSESTDQAPSQKPDLNLLSSTLHDSFTLVGAPVEVNKSSEGSEIPVAVEVQAKPAPPKLKTDKVEEVKQISQSSVEQQSKEPARKGRAAPSVPLRATSGGALIYRDGTVEFGMGGEAVLLPDGQTISCMLSYQGFPSVAASGLALKHGSWYYEVSLLTAGLMQIGWATPEFTGSCNDGEGVGDDGHSFAYDGFRQLKWSNGEPQRWGRKWKQGDVVCCAVDMDSGVIQYTLNGEWNTGVTTVAFADLNLTESGLMPALSFRKGEKCCINFGATEFAYAPPSQHFRGVHSAYNTEWNCAANFPSTSSPRNVPEKANATEQLAALLLKDDVRDAIGRFLGHPVVVTAVQHVAVAFVQDRNSAAKIARSQMNLVIPIFLQLLSEKPALLGLLPNVLELLQTLLLGSKNKFSACNFQRHRGGRNASKCQNGRRWCHQNPDMGKRPWKGRRGVPVRRSDPMSLARARGMHAKSRCPVNRAQQAISSFVKETGEQVSKWASNLCPESDAEKKFKIDLEKAIKMSMPPAKAEPPSGQAFAPEGWPHTAKKSSSQSTPEVEDNNPPTARILSQDQIDYPAPPRDHLSKDLEKAIELSVKDQGKVNEGHPVEISDFDRAVALSYEEHVKSPKTSSEGKNERKEKLKEAEAVKPSSVDSAKRLRAKFIEQRTFDAETGELVELSHVAPNTRLCHTWTMMNPSPEAWPPNVVGKTVGGDPKIITSQGWNTAAPVAAHSPVHITVEANAPHEPGRYISYFRLFDPVSDLPFGDRIWLDMTVSGPSSDTDWDMLHGDGKTNQ